MAFTLHGLRASYISAAHAAGVSDRHAKLLAMGTEAVPISIRQLLSTQRRQVCRRRSGCLQSGRVRQVQLRTH